MREIKFRAWDKESETMLTQDGWQFNFSNTGNHKIIAINDYSIKRDVVAPIEIMQFTGLKDKNGTEIFEGDIVTTGNGLKRLVIYDAPGFWLAKNTTDKIDVDSFSTPGAYEEVIGNIYENPELLKENQ